MTITRQIMWRLQVHFEDKRKIERCPIAQRIRQNQFHHQHNSISKNKEQQQIAIQNLKIARKRSSRE